MRVVRTLLRWSWRDLRAQWVKVIAIAAVIAIGTGAYAGLTSSANWRRMSNDASYELLAFHDLRVELTTDGAVPAGSLAAALDGVDAVEQVEERFVYETQVDASAAADAVPVAGLVIGADPAAAVDKLQIERGQAGAVLVEHNFAECFDLPSSGELTLSGARTVEYGGVAISPEYFVLAPEGQLFAECSQATLFTDVATAQELAGRPGVVNDAVLTVVADADPEALADEIEGLLDRELGVGAVASTRDDDPGFRALTEDVENDQLTFNVFAVLLFMGAVFAAFNLINRLAEQQRREIGIAMALGIRPRVIAVRPLLVGAQIALLGVVLGLGVGYLIAAAMRSVLTSFLTLPVWLTPLQLELFAGVAAIGFLIPFAAIAYPVWRAVRVNPVEAIAPKHLHARRGRLIRWLRRAPLPGSTFTQYPFRNMMRAPLRTVFTALGIGASITLLVYFLGVIDSFLETLDRAEAESVGDAPSRVVVQLDGIYAADSPQVTAVEEAETVARFDPVLRVPGTLASGEEEIDVLVDLLDLESGMWRPTITAGDASGLGLVLAEAAADDLGVSVGGTVVLEHPVQTGPDSFALAETPVPVAALHPNPFRNLAYLDVAALDLVGVDSAANALNVDPVAGASLEDVQRELFGLDAVASVEKAGAATESVREFISEFLLAILGVISFFVLILALLIGFNSASINFEARARDHATMFAFGVPVRTALRMAMTESFVMGVLATAVGLVAGVGLMWWAATFLFTSTVPDLRLALILTPATIVITVLVGIVAVTLAPIFTVRRMRRMDLPGTLRLME